jgi:solute carrier family 36 (proton-coupled amino acid transporter)
MMGFSIFSFEGISIVMPIMKSTEKPEKFGNILIAAIATLVSIFVIFGLLGSLAYGSAFSEQMVTEMLPTDSTPVIIMKLCMVVSLFCSYAIYILPCNIIIDGWLSGIMKKDSSKLKYF